MDTDNLGGVGNMDRTALPDAPEDMVVINDEDASGLPASGSVGSGSGSYSSSADEDDVEIDEELSGQLSAGGVGSVDSTGNPAEGVQSDAQQSEIVDNGSGLSGTENTTGADEPDLAG